MGKQKPMSFDVIIAGGGATGLALAALLLKQTKLKIALIEAAASDHKNVQNESDSSQSDFLDLRSIALSAQSGEILAKAGLSTLADIACPIAHIHVSDQGYLGRCTLHADDYQLPALGQVVELPSLTAKLLESVNQHADRFTPFYQSEIEQLTRTDSSVTVTLSSQHVLQAKLLVVAEGGQSPTRQKLGIDVTTVDYQQTALVANVELNDPHQNWAYERFTENGPLALLPLPSLQQKHRSALVWTATANRYAQLREMSDEDFIEELQQQFGYRLGRIKGVGRRSGFALQLSYAQQHIHHRAALVGNACQSLHPIAGQGLNLALRDVHQLAELIIANQQQDIGRYQLLHQYQQARKQDQERLITVTNALVKTFSNRYLPLVIGRNLALTLLDNIASVKHAFALSAMGFSSEAAIPVKSPTKTATGKTHAKS